MNSQPKRWAPYKADTVGVRIVAGKGCSRERLLAMGLLSEGILMVRDKESTSTKDIRMARNISREDNHEVPSTVQTVFKTTPKIPNPPPIISPCDPFHPAHRAPRPPFPAGALKRQKLQERQFRTSLQRHYRRAIRGARIASTINVCRGSAAEREGKG